MRFLLIFLFLPATLIAQDQELAEKNCLKWIKFKMSDDTATFNHLLFTDLEEVETLSEEGVKAMEKLEDEKYKLFHDKLNEEKLGDYKTQRADLLAKMKATEDAHSTVTGYEFVHKFQAKDKDGFKVDYKVTYQLDLEMNIVESSIKRHVDRASSDY